MAAFSFKAWCSAHASDLRLALSILLASLLSFALAQALHIPEPFWAVISAAVVGRSTMSGAFKSGLERLLGTLAGAVVGFAGALARHWPVPEMVLLALVIAPLAVITSIRRDLRAAMMAGLIVFSAASAGTSPLAPALLRVFDVLLGAGVALLVSAAVGWSIGFVRRRQAKRLRALEAQ